MMSSATSGLPVRMASIDIGDEYLWEPERLVPFEHWSGHIPFAFWLVKNLRPRTIVELGTHRGNSYCAFCQAVSRLHLSTTAAAVDTWEGDRHMSREAGLHAELSAYHDARYDGFSRLLRMTFDDARAKFGDGSIDLLHVDGTHTYETVRHDFENWRSALSARAVVLFHDIVVHQPEFGVWKLWNEISAQYPSFAFDHSYGLGVLGFGPEQDKTMIRLYEVTKEEAAASDVRRIFAARGDAFVTRVKLADSDARLDKVLVEHEQARLCLKNELESVVTQHAVTLQNERDEAERRARALHAAHTCELQGEKDKARLWMAELQAAHRRELATERDAVRYRENVSEARLRAAQVSIHSLGTAVQEAREGLGRMNAQSAILGMRLAAIEGSTMWRVLRPARRLSTILPSRLRRLIRHAVAPGRRSNGRKGPNGASASN